MRRAIFLFLVACALAAPVAAIAADVPAPAVVACQAEYAQLGAASFTAKYGPSEPFGHCYQQHATVSDDPATATCKAE